MSSASNVEEPPHKKKVKVETSHSFPLSSLPDELALSCLARVSPSDYASLSRVSKRYRSLLVSHKLYKTRLLMSLTEKRHYVCLCTRNNSTPVWYILRREKIKFRLIPITLSPPNYQYIGSSVVVLDWGIYVIGGLKSGKPTSDVMLLDCTTHTWRQVPSMRVARMDAAAGVVGGKIYVFGGCKYTNSSRWGEVFDPKTQSWDTLVPMPDKNIRLKCIHTSFVIEEKLYAVEYGEVQQTLNYSPSEGKWGRKNLDSGLENGLMIDKILYGLDSGGKLLWYEKEEFKWKEVKGLDSSFWNLFTFGWTMLCKLINFGGNIVVVLLSAPDPKVYGASLEIRCAEISLERRQEGDEVWGKVELSGSLITLHHATNHIGAPSYSVSVNL